MTDNLPATTSPMMGTVGLEDVDVTDVRLPILKINHPEAVFEDSLSGEKFEEMEVIFLGLVKQRVLWDPEIKEEKTGPLCKSFDHDTGYPFENFPWDKQEVFSAPEDPTAPNPLPCKACKLKDWGTHPTRGDTPWCTEQYTFIVLTNVGSEEDPSWSPSLLTLQKSSMKPANTYLSNFVRAKKPMFIWHTKISLDAKRRGSTRYAVPKFEKSSGTDEANWPEWGEMYVNIRELIQTPRLGDEPDEVEVDTPKPQRRAASSSAAKTGGEVIVLDSDEDDEVPF